VEPQHSGANSSSSSHNQKPSLVFLRAPNLEDAASYFVAGSELLEEIEISSSREYGDIFYHSIQQPQQKDVFRSREIDSDDEDNYNEQRAAFIKRMEKHNLLSKEKYDPYDDLDFPRKCTRPQWAWDKYFTCNTVHSLSYDRTPQSRHQFHKIKYLAHGAFRDSFMFTPTAAAIDSIPFVTKTKIYDRDLDNRDVYKISTEANLLEKFSPSPLTSSIYAYCGTTILVERGREIDDDIIPYRRGYHHGRIRQSELDELQEKDVQPMNQDVLTVEKKLDIAIAMAESLAEMHGYVGGVVTNDDIALGQWLYADDGRVILNDFNDAMYVDWNYEKQEYCKYWRSFGGTFKAPEEYDGDYLDESVDVWPMGNIIFALLTGTLMFEEGCLAWLYRSRNAVSASVGFTIQSGFKWSARLLSTRFAHLLAALLLFPGLMPYYEIKDEEEIQEATKKGPPYIDPRYKTRSYIEGRMVEIMNRCHKLKASERVDIFEVVRHLRETRELYQQNNQRRRFRG